MKASEGRDAKTGVAGPAKGNCIFLEVLSQHEREVQILVISCEVMVGGCRALSTPGIVWGRMWQDC
jgi:hypothetical protein